MSKKKWLLLKVINQNWNLNGPGDWVETTWRIFNDGSYEVISSFNPSVEDLEEMLRTKRQPKPVRKKRIGIMDETSLSKLQMALKCDPWRDPFVDNFDCDGDAWDISLFKEDGSINKTSGILDYIYGHRVLETIVSCLPLELHSGDKG